MKMLNLCVVTNARAHNSRHLHKRASAADPILQYLLHTAVLKPHNIARQIKNSQPLRHVFVCEAHNQERQNKLIATVTDMPFAAQRFDSLQKPLGRTVVTLEALVSYCHLVIRERRATSEERQGCAAPLSSLTEENVILMGMMGDASDECTILTRFMDRETFEIGSMWS